MTKTESCSLLIAGGGAAGLMAGIAAARLLPAPHRIIILEKENRTGRKLLATGNGRCNLTNLSAGPETYFGSQPHFARGALYRFSVSAAMSLFEEIGLLTRLDEDGRVYPYSNQAAGVLDVLRLELHRLGVTVITEQEVEKIEREEPLYFGRTPVDDSAWFLVTTADKNLYKARRLVLATGGMAAPSLGGNASGYELLSVFGHTLVKPFPALAPLCLSESAAKKLSGIRFEAAARLCLHDEELQTSRGEFLWTDYGLSGIAAMELARAVNVQIRQGAGPLHLEIDFLPDMNADALLHWLRQRREKHPDLVCDRLLTGLFHRRLGEELVRRGIRNSVLVTMAAARISDEHLQNLVKTIKNMTTVVASTRDWAQAQITAGGLSTDEFHPDRMESKLCPGLFTAGEVLDIDGPCGGYNLQWAWSSGWLAGFRAAGDLLRTKTEPDHA